MFSIKALAMVTIIGVLAGCEQVPDKSSSGEDLFNYHCAGCHQASGKGKYLQKIPANALTRLSKHEVVNLIRSGSQAKPHMPPVKNITYGEARKIADHLWVLRAEALKQ